MKFAAHLHTFTGTDISTNNHTINPPETTTESGLTEGSAPMFSSSGLKWGIYNVANGTDRWLIGRSTEVEVTRFNPEHTHTVDIPSFSSGNGGGHTPAGTISQENGHTPSGTLPTNGAHTHTISGATETAPDHMYLYYIMYVGL